MSAGVAIFALALRLLYVQMAVVEFPIRGDSSQYVLYAWNLSHRGVFSSNLPDASPVVSDSYRGPGYPALLAATMVVAGHADLPLREGPNGRNALGYDSDSWMRIALVVQSIIGAISVWLVIAIGRLWLPPWAAFAAGLLTALWPHLVTFTGVLLSETLFCFGLLLSCWLLCRAQAALSRGAMAAAGSAWGLTYLVNPIVALFPLVLAPFIAMRSGKILALIFLGGFALAPSVWTLRNNLETSGSGALQRIEENFVQGSWPDFLVAFNTRFSDKISGQIIDAVERETQQLKDSPREGIGAIASRLMQDPAYYLGWYFARKPFLLWDWHLRVGAGDIYFLPVQHSAFERIPVLSAVRTVFRVLNPLLFLLGLLACVAILLVAPARGTRPPFGALTLGLLSVYLTGMHVILQAEPRYSIPYRPAEILLAITMIAWSVDMWRKHRSSKARTSLDSMDEGIGYNSRNEPRWPNT
jgi:hypothetical protein